MGGSCRSNGHGLDSKKLPEGNWVLAHLWSHRSRRSVVVGIGDFEKLRTDLKTECHPLELLDRDLLTPLYFFSFKDALYSSSLHFSSSMEGIQEDRNSSRRRKRLFGTYARQFLASQSRRIRNLIRSYLTGRHVHSREDSESTA